MKNAIIASEVEKKDYKSTGKNLKELLNNPYRYSLYEKLPNRVESQKAQPKQPFPSTVIQREQSEGIVHDATMKPVSRPANANIPTPEIYSSQQIDPYHYTNLPYHEDKSIEIIVPYKTAKLEDTRLHNHPISYNNKMHPSDLKLKTNTKVEPPVSPEQRPYIAQPEAVTVEGTGSVGYLKDFTQPDFQSFQLPSFDIAGKEHFGLGSFPLTMPWSGEEGRRDGKGFSLPSGQDTTELGGQGGVLGSYQWWSRHPVHTWSSASFHRA